MSLTIQLDPAIAEAVQELADEQQRLTGRNVLGSMDSRQLGHQTGRLTDGARAELERAGD